MAYPSHRAIRLMRINHDMPVSESVSSCRGLLVLCAVCGTIHDSLHALF